MYLGQPVSAVVLNLVQLRHLPKLHLSPLLPLLLKGFIHLRDNCNMCHSRDICNSCDMCDCCNMCNSCHMCDNWDMCDSCNMCKSYNICGNKQTNMLIFMLPLFLSQLSHILQLLQMPQLSIHVTTSVTHIHACAHTHWRHDTRYKHHA